RDSFVFLIQVGDDELIQVSSNATGLSVAGEELDRVRTRQKSKTGVVFDGTLGEFRRRYIGEFDVGFVAYVLDRRSELILDFTDEIDEGALVATFAGECELAAGDFDGYRDEVFGTIELEVIDLHRDGQVGDGIAQQKCVLELSFLVDRVE